MFGRRKILTEGVAAEAVVVDTGGGSQRGAMFGLQLRVRFDDGSTGEVLRRIGLHGPDELPWFVVGSVVPVRYDPTDHSKVEIDMPALKEAHAAARAAEQQRAIESAEEGLHGSP
jgi:hypothetical protein